MLIRLGFQGRQISGLISQKYLQPDGISQMAFLPLMANVHVLIHYSHQIVEVTIMIIKVITVSLPMVAVGSKYGIWQLMLV